MDEMDEAMGRRYTPRVSVTHRGRKAERIRVDDGGGVELN
jgi:hypothetical protein